MSDLQIRRVENFQDYGLVAAVRTIVYVIEQACPYAEEFDADDNHAVYYLGTVGGQPASTCRILYPQTGLAKIGRIATLKEHRGKGYASAMVRHAIEEIKKKGGVSEIKMSAQDHALGLYEKLGFSAYGDVYDEAGIPHRMMVMALG